MPDYKNQHWLPSGYMKFFSITGTPQGRNTRIYHSDGTSSETKKVEKLSCDDYHYSINDPEGAETSWREIENDYPLIAEDIINGNPIKKKHYFGMILTMIDFNARNPSYSNLTTEENYEAYQIVSRGWISEVFADLQSDGSDPHKMKDFLSQNWVLQRITSQNEKFISSDHPSLIFSIQDKIAFIMLPVNPNHNVLAYDQRKIQLLSNSASDTDVANLNGLQAARSINYVYSDHDLTQDIGPGKALTKHFNKSKPRGFVKGDSWLPEFISYENAPNGGFSFIKSV